MKWWWLFIIIIIIIIIIINNIIIINDDVESDMQSCYWSSVVWSMEFNGGSDIGHDATYQLRTKEQVSMLHILLS